MARQARAKRQKPATISFKLSVLRAFFAYLVALKLVEKNPADAKFVMPPKLPEQMSGRALTPEEVGKLLAGPDKRKAEGARDYALMLAILDGEQPHPGAFCHCAPRETHLGVKENPQRRDLTLCAEDMIQQVR